MLIRMGKKNAFRNKWGIITLDPMDIKGIKKGILSAHKFDNSDEMDQFLDKYELPKLT